MDRDPAIRRRHARAVAISASVDAQKKAVVARIAMALAVMALTAEAILVAQHWMLASH